VDGPYNEVEERDSVVVLTRTERSYESVEAIRVEAAALARRYPPAARRERVVLRDLRRARGETDPVLEAERTRRHAELFAGWRHVVVLVATEVGRLHVRRVLEEMGVEGECFTDALAAREAARAAR